MKKLLNDYGFSYIFKNANMINAKSFLCELKCRIVDAFKQEWFGNMNDSSVLDMYKYSKQLLNTKLT